MLLIKSAGRPVDYFCNAGRPAKQECNYHVY